MFTIKITKLSRASLAGVILLIAASLLLSVTQARAQTLKAQNEASSLAEVTLKPGAKLLVILSTGEKVKGKDDNIGDGTLSIKINISTNPPVTFGGDYKIRTLSESEIFRIYQVKGTSRGRGAKMGALIGAAAFTVGTLVGVLGLDTEPDENGLPEPPILAVLSAIVGASIGSAIGALVVSGEENILMYQNPAISPPPGLKTGLLNFRDGRLSFALP